MANAWDSDEIRSLENNIRNNFVNSYNGQTKIDNNDSRLTNIERERQEKISQSNAEYNKTINDVNNHYNNVNQALDQGYAKKEQAMNQQTQATIDNINTQKDRAERNYQNEQRGSYIDYRNAINPYGAQAELRASRGLANSGYSETYQSNAYNTWQNRVATAKQSLNDALVDYNAQITNARNTNSTALAELWSNVALQKAQNSLQGFQYKNTLIENRNQRETQLQQLYDTKYQNMYKNISEDLNRQISNYQYGINTLNEIRKNREKSNQWQAEYDRQKEQYRKQLEIERARLSETRRHNQATESLQRQQLARARATASRRSSSGGRSSSMSSVQNDAQSVLKNNMEILQGPGIQNIFRDKRTGRTYPTPEALLASYGIGASR